MSIQPTSSNQPLKLRPFLEAQARDAGQTVEECIASTALDSLTPADEPVLNSALQLRSIVNVDAADEQFIRAIASQAGASPTRCDLTVAAAVVASIAADPRFAPSLKQMAEIMAFPPGQVVCFNNNN